MASSYLKSKIPEILKKCYQLVKHRMIDRIRQFQNEKHNDSEIRAESSEKSQDSDQGESRAESSGKSQGSDQGESRAESSEKSQGSDQGESRAESSEKSQDSNQSKADSSDTKYIQILFYYIQDATLFKVHLPDDGHVGESLFVKVIKFSPEMLASVITKVVEVCLTFSSPPITKVLMKSLFGPSLMVFLLFIWLTVSVVSKLRYCSVLNILNTMKGAIFQAFLYGLLFSYQQMVTGAFTLVQCVNVGGNKVLYVQGDIDCFTWWQVAVQFFIITNIFPILVVLAVSPFYVKNKTMSTRLFTLACVFPLPVLLYFAWSQRRINDSESVEFIEETEPETEQQREPCHEDLSNTENSTEGLGESGDGDLKISVVDKISQVSQGNSGSSFSSKSSTKSTVSIKVDDCLENEEVIVSTLLEHYKCLNLCGLNFTWLGIHKLYRVVLVACNTYITDPLWRLWIMTIILMILAILNTVVKPYKDTRANLTSVLSYSANLCIAIINISKTTLATFDCKTNCSLKVTLFWYFGLCDNILLIYIPFTAFVGWVIFSIVKKIASKLKDE